MPFLNFLFIGSSRVRLGLLGDIWGHLASGAGEKKRGEERRREEKRGCEREEEDWLLGDIWGSLASGLLAAASSLLPQAALTTAAPRLNPFPMPAESQSNSEMT